MKTQFEIDNECIEVYDAIKDIMKQLNTDHCQSWWANSRNCSSLRHLSSREIVRRANKLVRDGYLTIDKKRTSSSTGTCYMLTEKILND